MDVLNQQPQEKHGNLRKNKTQIHEVLFASYMSLLVNYLISDHYVNLFCFTETWLQQKNHVCFNESTPFIYLGQGGGVAIL